jgi:pantothenate kinase
MSALDISSDSVNSETIELPITDELFKHLRNAKRFGMDIGGSLVKIAYSSSFECKEASLSEEDESSDLIYSVHSKVSKIPTLNFIKFETKYIEAALDFIAKNLTGSQFNDGKSILVTGGGAYKYKDLIAQKLNVQVEKEDEMKCLINGCNFLIKTVPNEVFTVDDSSYKSYGHEFKLGDMAENLFPYLLVNIGMLVNIGRQSA